MKVMIGNRGSGMSTNLLSEVQKTGGIFICATRSRAKDLEKRYDNPNIKFTTLYEIVHSGVNPNFEEADIYIDDFETSLNLFFATHGYKGRVKAVGTTWGIGINP